MSTFPLRNEHLLQILNEGSEGIIIYNLALEFVYVNKAAEKFGLTSEVIGKLIFEIYPYVKPHESTILEVIRTKKAVIRKEYRFVTYRKELKTTLCSTYPLFDSENNLIGVFDIFEDTSAIVNLNEKIMKFNEKFSNNKVEIALKKENWSFSEQKSFSIIGKSKEIIEVIDKIKLYGKSKSPVLIFGETGTGKELAVQEIHNAGNPNSPFISQNCAAIPETLLESILFGTIEGSFTGAKNQKGLFEMANYGTLFLDELNSMPLSLQAKLLRTIEDGKVRRVGAEKETPVNVRVIASTNVNPQILVEENEMREDLFFRLNVLYLELPPLRDRKDDIPFLVYHFLEYFNKEFNKNVKHISRDVFEYFIDYDWPGNIRELKNNIERAMNIVEGDEILFRHIQPGLFTKVERFSKQIEEKSIDIQEGSLRERVCFFEKEIIEKCLIKNEGNVSRTARQLDIPQQTLNNKIKKYKLRKLIYKIKATHF